MDKQQADHIDHKIRQAAAHSDPPFKEEAWQRMEAKLDEDLHRKRRRGLIWWWTFGIFILAGGLGVYTYQQVNLQDNEKKDKVSVASENKSQKPGGYNGNRPGAEIKTGGKVSLKHLAVTEPDENNKAGAQPAGNKKPGQVHQQKYLPGEPETINAHQDELIKEPVVSLENVVKDPVQQKGNPGTDTISTGRHTNPGPSATPARDSLKTVISEKKKQEKVSGFYFIPNVAMDATALKKFSIKQMRPVFGAAIGYRINNRLGVQTGFYAGKKIYQAGPGDYKIKPGSYLSMVDMIRIGADCYIYEIPLSVRYDIMAGKRSRIYALSGLTSVIMKRETYDYHYRSNNAYRSMETTYNGNKHLFSLLNVSAGYEHKISKALHIQAEPYINFPLSGVGEGEVKLYSAGLRAGIKYAPVKKNKIIIR